MFANKEEKQQKTKVATIMGKGTKISGDLQTDGSVRVEGLITGKIKANGDVFVGKEAIIKTEIEARKVVIAGTVEADVIAHELLEIMENGVLKGDIQTDKLRIHEGGKFIGNSKLLNENLEKSKNDYKKNIESSKTKSIDDSIETQKTNKKKN